MNKVVEQIFSLLNDDLYYSSPVLSGNMRAHIKIGNITPEYKELIIEAPFYDMDKWKKEGVIELTGESKNGYTDYAYWVNKSGAFGRHNRSEHWVNRCIYDSVMTIANEIGAQVINELPL